MNRMVVFLITLHFIGVIFDIYFYFGVRSFFNTYKTLIQFKSIYWSISVFYYLLALLYIIFFPFGIEANRTIKMLGQIIFFVLFVPKILASSFIIIDDVIRLIRFVIRFLIDTFSSKKEHIEGITRLKFLQLSALGSFGVLLGSLTYGVIKGGYRYTVKNQKITIPNLPDEFKGLKIAQISDLHVGSFMSLEPMKEAVNLINEQDVDMLFFTGDLVNEKAEEALDFINVFKNIKHKVYSVLGNHDYPEYVYARDDHPSRKHNFDLMVDIHKKMNFDLLLNEHRIVERNGKKMAIIGIENWGSSFSKYGDMKKAYEGTQEADVKLLLSHDPSHWDLQVRPDYSDVDVTFSGHTHGMQFGVEAFGIKFSPVQWVYKQWAGLYKEGAQQLYVNRGLGFIGFPGRVGISPEITVFELTS